MQIPNLGDVRPTTTKLQQMLSTSVNASTGFSPVGTDLLPWLVLALGAAMVVGTVLAILRPRQVGLADELARAPLTRSLVMIGVGLLGAIWALATLLVG